VSLQVAGIGDEKWEEGGKDQQQQAREEDLHKRIHRRLHWWGYVQMFQVLPKGIHIWIGTYTKKKSALDHPNKRVVSSGFT